MTRSNLDPIIFVAFIVNVSCSPPEQTMKSLVALVTLSAFIFGAAVAMPSMVTPPANASTRAAPQVLKREVAGGFSMEMDLSSSAQRGSQVVAPTFLEGVLSYSENPTAFVSRRAAGTLHHHERAPVSVKSTLIFLREGSVSIWDEESGTSRPQNVLSYEVGTHSLHGSM